MEKRILFLQSEIHNYHISLLNEIVNNYECRVDVIYQDLNTQTPYVPPIIEGVNFIGNSHFYCYDELKKYVKDKKYDLVRTSGWSNKHYVRLSRYLKKRGIQIVVVSDTQWKKNIRQTIGAVLFGRYIKNSFSKIMVAGPYQYEYARKLGFNKKDILFNNLSADTNVYNTLFVNEEYEKIILYVGNLEKVKGTDLLLKAWSSITDKRGWKLVLIGNGSFYNYISDSDIIFKGYLPNTEISKMMQHAGFFVLPSKSEQWGVVMHEAVLSGLPILCSDEIGSIPYFLIQGYNGFTFRAENLDDLISQLNVILNLSENQILLMKKNSLSLGKRITTPISAASLMSVISRY
jgi:glycosyltransferase involved in cell wall biosynthesis